MRRPLLLAAVLALCAIAVPAPAQGAGPQLGVDVGACVTPVADAAFVVLPVNDGKAFTSNSCLAQQATGTRPVQLFTNGAMPGPGAANWPGDVCANVLSSDCAARYGAAAATDALSTVTSSGAQQLARTWWLDVENLNTWAGPTAYNVASIRAELSTLRSRPDLVAAVGIYSSKAQWQEIAGSDQTLTVPQWTATPMASYATAKTLCQAKTSFTRGPVVMAQYARDASTDGDYACPPRLATHAPLHSGTPTVLRGSALPGQTVTIQTHQPDRSIHVYTALTGADGTWSRTVTLKYSGTIAVGNDAGSTTGQISVDPTLTVHVAGARCGVTATGTVTPRWPGQLVTVVVSGGRSAVVGTNVHGAWHAAIAEPCGSRISVQARVGRTRWASTGRSRSPILRTLG